jgi:GTPase KRas
MSVMDINISPGEEEIAAIRDQWIGGCDGFLIIFSVTSKRSFADVQRYIDQIERVHNKQMPTIIVGNKSDLEMSRVVNSQQAAAYAQSCGALYMETSAKTGENIDHVFTALLSAIYGEGSLSAVQVNRAKNANQKPL